MLTKYQVRHYSAESELRDIKIAEKEIILTYFLQLLSEKGILKQFAFKGGTCLRKMVFGNQSRFSTDLDFTALSEHDHESVILDMMEAFIEPFHGIKFDIPNDSYYETLDGLSWGINPTYSHSWNHGGGTSIVKIQISRREMPSLAVGYKTQCEQSYFKHLPFTPVSINCLSLSEIIAEKIRACYQRNKARDIYDLGLFAKKPLDQALIRRLVVLKIWQSRDTFVPERLMDKFKEGDFDWTDLKDLVRRSLIIDHKKITAECLSGYRFLVNLTEEEKILAKDSHQRERKLWQSLRTRWDEHDTMLIES